MDERYREKRRQIEELFLDAAKEEGSEEQFVSPSGRFQLTVSAYVIRERKWQYSRGIVTRLSDGGVVADIKRNYGTFWHAWAAHPNGNEYLLCGEDYQGYSCFNLTQGLSHIYLPEEGYRGIGFCWAAAYPSSDGRTLAVDGCYWACPYDLVLLDFRTPDSLPFPELLRVGSLYHCEGWLDNDTFVISSQTQKVRKSDGMLYEHLTAAERNVIDTDNSLIEIRQKRVLVKRPPEC